MFSLQSLLEFRFCIILQANFTRQGSSRCPLNIGRLLCGSGSVRASGAAFVPKYRWKSFEHRSEDDRGKGFCRSSTSYASRIIISLSSVIRELAVMVLGLVALSRLPPILGLHRSRYPPFNPAPSYTSYFSVANLSTRSVLALWLLVGHSTCRADNGCSWHAQPLFVLFPVYSHAGRGEAYDQGEERVECPKIMVVSSGGDRQRG